MSLKGRTPLGGLCPSYFLKPGYEAYVHQTFRSDDTTIILKSKVWFSIESVRKLLCDLTHACLSSLFWL